jgi:hypothetical protein
VVLEEIADTLVRMILIWHRIDHVEGSYKNGIEEGSNKMQVIS